MSDNLCEELMVEIFTRLPPKSLLRFRSVSKSLRTFIDSPDFIRMHTSKSPQSIIFLHFVRHDSVEEYGDGAFYTIHAQDQLPLSLSGYIGITPFKSPRKKFNIAGSCNGILLLLEYRKGIITLWNPSIMRQLAIPDCPLRCIRGVGNGIGFDPITDDYKIVRIPLNGDRNGETTFFYSMKTRVWCPITSPRPLYTEVVSRPWYLNGVLHWVITDGELHYIMTLDLGTRVFGMIDLPKPNWETQTLSTIQGCLAVFSRVTDDTWIWVRRDASWCLIFKSKENQVDKGLCTALELTNNGDWLLDTFEEGVQVYNPKTGARSTLVDLNDTSSVFDMYTYVETLQLLDIGIACDVNNIFLQDKKKEKASLDASFK